MEDWGLRELFCLIRLVRKFKEGRDFGFSFEKLVNIIYKQKVFLLQLIVYVNEQGYEILYYFLEF